MSWRELAYLILPRLLLIVGLLLPAAGDARHVLAAGDLHRLHLCPAGPELSISWPITWAWSRWGRLFVGAGGYLCRPPEQQARAVAPALRSPVAALLGGVVCTLLLLPCLPLRGVYFAIVTLMYPLFLARVIEALNILGRHRRHHGHRQLPERRGWSSISSSPLVLVFLFGLRRLVNTGPRAGAAGGQGQRPGGAGLRHEHHLLQGHGRLHRLLPSAASPAPAWSTSTCGPGFRPSRLDFSMLPIAATVIGGSGTLVGPVIGCLILVPVSELLRDFGTLRIVFYSLILLAFIVFRSEGLMVYGQRKYHQFERWKAI
ncbi:MAG: hypothetical protein MZU95_00235 [Desulfomicrobium escambiense]|nr:hypothetical protein [Desulfomicrobium escambiense]